MLKQKDRANEQSKLREGTKCKICGMPITAEDFRNYNVISTEGGCLGSVIYGHKECCKKRDYSYEHLVRNKKATYSGVQFGVELETNDTTTAEQRPAFQVTKMLFQKRVLSICSDPPTHASIK